MSHDRLEFGVFCIGSCMIHRKSVRESQITRYNELFVRLISDRARVYIMFNVCNFAAIFLF